METVGSAPASVRELIVELAEVEDELRRCSGSHAEAQGASTKDQPVDLVHREQQIVHELRRRVRTRRPR